MKKLRILQINAVYGKSSTGEIVKDISKAILGEGWESYVGCAKVLSADTEESGKIQIGNDLDYKLHALCSRVFGLQGYFSGLSTLLFLRKIDRIKPDIIHVHNLHSNFININLLFKYIRKRRIHTIITLHDCWFFTGKCYHYLYDNCYRWEYGCGDCPRIKKEIPSYFFDFTKAVYKEKQKNIGDNPYVHIVGVSKWITEEAKRSLLKSKILYPICNGVDLQIFRPRESLMRKDYSLEDKFVILGMANKWLAFENKKTYEFIIDNLKENYTLVLLGCNKECVSQQQVINIPFVSDRVRLAEIYSMADVFVNVTKVDSLPTVNIEAIACGTPVITYNSGGSAEIIDSSVGHVVEYGNMKKLLNAIYDIEEKGKKHFTTNCRRKAALNYDKTFCYKKYIEIYMQLSQNSDC